MREVLVQFASLIDGHDGRSYRARVCGRDTEAGTWEGWIEFDPEDGSHVLRTPRETSQPNRNDLEYWATGLTRTYLEGALERAREPVHVPSPEVEVKVEPAYEGPAVGPAEQAVPAPRPHGVLDPFAVYAQGERVLRRELDALDPDHLRDIVREHRLVDEEQVELEALQHEGLEEIILAAARRRAG